MTIKRVESLTYGADDPSTESVIADQRLEDAGYRETGVVVLVRGEGRVGPVVGFEGADFVFELGWIAIRGVKREAEERG